MATSQNEAIFVGNGNDRFQLAGADLEAFLADRALLQAEATAQQAEADAQAAARESALAKLSALGLTSEEIASL